MEKTLSAVDAQRRPHPLAQIARRYQEMAWQAPDQRSSELYATIAEDYEILAAGTAAPSATLADPAPVTAATPRRAVGAVTAWLRDLLSSERARAHSFSLTRFFF